MRRILAEIPRLVQISIGVLLGVGVLYGLLAYFLGGALEAALAENRNLKDGISEANKGLGQIEEDHQFVLDNQKRFEELLQNGRLVPHTRRAAIVALQDAARATGLTAMDYSFVNAGGATPAKAMPKESGAYRVSAEAINLKVGASTDGAVYRFLINLDESFPGSIVLQSIGLTRAPKVTDEALKRISEGKDSQLVSGDVKLLWRTAQAQEQKNAETGK